MLDKNQKIYRYREGNGASMSRTIRGPLDAFERAAAIAKQRGQSVNSVLARALVAGLPVVEAEGVTDER